MANTKQNIYTRRDTTPNRSAFTQARWRGYDDVRNHRGFPADYDGMPELLQRNYELGRTQALAAIVELGAAPPWARNRLLRYPAGAMTPAWRAEFAYHASIQRPALAAS